jgi:hypothetical protein
MDARATYDPTFKPTTYNGPTEASLKTPSTFNTVASNAEANPKLIAAAAAPAIAEDMEPKPYQAPERKVDADMGQRLGYESGYDNSIPGRTGNPQYVAISNEEAKKRYGFADGGDVETPFGMSQGGDAVVRMADGGAADTSYDAVTYGMPSTTAQQQDPTYDATRGYTAEQMAKAAARAVPSLVASLSAPEHGYGFDQATGRYTGSGTDLIYKGGGQYGKSAAEIEAEKKLAEEQAAASAPPDYVGGAANGGLMAAYAGGGLSGTIQEALSKLRAQGAFGEPQAGDTGTGYTYDANTKQYTVNAANGGGISEAHYNLGGYSDGGRLLKGPGDGVSDSIPAVIGRKQPARLADGEFVVPARIVSEIGNGSTEAGARKLYAMMDRVQKARGKTVGKGKVAKNTRADKFLPA